MTAQSFDELIPLAKQLNDESSDLNSTITQINQKLSSLNFGIEVWLGPWENEPLQIGFAKINDGRTSRWELATRSCTAVKAKDSWGNDGWEAKPGSQGASESLLAASRNVRIDGLDLVGDILRLLKSAAEEKIRKIQKAKKIAAEFEPPATASPAEQPSTGEEEMYKVMRRAAEQSLALTESARRRP